MTTNITTSAMCEVNTNLITPAWKSSVGGVDVTGEANVQIRLANEGDGVDSWRLELIAISDGTDPPILTPPANFTLPYEFSAPVDSDNGSMLVFRSIVNGGMSEAIITLYVLGTRGVLGPVKSWSEAASYSVNDLIRPDGDDPNNTRRLYKCIVAGDRGATAPVWPTERGEVVSEDRSLMTPANWREFSFDRYLLTPDNVGRTPTLRLLHGLSLGTPHATLDVQQFGAGTFADPPEQGQPTPDDLAFAEAIAVLTAMGGGTLRIPSGNYKLTRTLGPCPPDTTLLGDGSAGASVLEFHSTGMGINAYDASGANGNLRFTLEDLLLDNAIGDWSSFVNRAVNPGDLVLPRPWSSTGLVYECLSSTETKLVGAREPRWKVSKDAEIEDGDVVWKVKSPTGAGIRTWEPGMLVSVNSLVVPYTLNGFIYICTAAGTTGETQPAWPTALNAVEPDGTAQWKALNPEWTDGATVSFGQIVRGKADATDHFFMCETLEGGTTNGTEPVWVTTAGDASPSDNGIVWREIGRLADDVEGLYLVPTWHPSLPAEPAPWSPAEGTFCLPRVPNGWAYECITPGDAPDIADPMPEPGIPYGETPPPEPPAGPIPGNWPVNEAQVANAGRSGDYTVDDGIDGLKWARWLPTLDGLRCTVGGTVDVVRSTFAGWQRGVVLEGVEGGEVRQGYFGGGSARGVASQGPSFGSIGVMVGGTAYFNTTAGIAVHGCLFNAPETCVYQDGSDPNVRIFDNVSEGAEFGRLARIGGGLNVIIENNTIGDPPPNTNCAVLVDGAFDLTIKDNFLLVPGRTSAIVFHNGVSGFTLTGNQLYGGNAANPTIRTNNLLLAPAFIGPNTFSSAHGPGEIPSRFDVDVSPTSLISLNPDGFQSGESGGRVGLNTFLPSASLDLAHSSAGEAPMVLMRDETQLYHENCVVPARPGDDFHIYSNKRMIREHNKLASEEPGNVLLLEGVRIGGVTLPEPPAEPELETADICRFAIAPDTNVFAEMRVVARRDDGGLGTWTRRNSFRRDGDAAVIEMLNEGASRDLAIVTEAPDPEFPDFGAPGAPDLVIDDNDDFTLTIGLTGFALVDSNWEGELRLTIASTYDPNPTLTSAVLAGGDLTITGTQLLTYGIGGSMVFITGAGGGVLRDDAILAGSGTVSETEIFIPAALIPEVTTANDVRVRANGTDSPTIDVTV